MQLKTLTNRAVYTANTKLIMLFASAMGLMSGAAHAAVTPLDMTQDQSGGKTLTDVANSANDVGMTAGALALNIMGVVGFIIVAFCFYLLWKSSKQDARENPVPAIVGLIIGGLMTAAGAIAWIVRMSFLGAPA
jgi:hypothetical protein